MNRNERTVDDDRKVLLIALIRFFAMIRKWKNLIKRYDYRKAYKYMRMIKGLYATIQSLCSLLPAEYQAEILVLIDAELDDAYDFEKQHFVEVNYRISKIKKRRKNKL